MAIDFSTFTEAQRADIDKWSPETQSFMDEWAAANESDKLATVVKRYLRWGNGLNNKSTYGGKLEYIKTIYKDTPNLYKEGVLPAAADWISLNNPNILDANGMPFTSGFYKDIISGDATTQKTNTTTLDNARKTSATDYVTKTLNAKGTLDAKTKASYIDEIINGTAAKPYTPTKLSTATSAVRGTAAYTPGTKTFDELKATYGGFLDSSGKPVFPDKDLKAVADAQTLGEISTFNTKLNSLADSVLKAQGSSYVSLDPVKKAEAKQALFRDPTTFVTSVNGLNKTNKTNLGTPSTLTGGAGIDTLTPAKSLKTWKAPQQPKDGVYTATANSPYSGLLDSILSKVTGTTYGDPTINEKYKNLTDPLTQGMGIDSLPKPKVTYDDTTKAGITGLGDISGTLQPLNTQVTSTPTYNPNQIANANTALENAAAIAGKVVDPGQVVGPWTELGITQAQYEAGQKSFADARLLAANARLSHYDADKTVADKLGITKDQYANDQSAYTKVRNAASPPVTAGPWTELGITQAQYEAGQKSFADAKARGDAARAATAATNNGIGSLTQGTDVVNQNLVPTNTDNTVSNVYGADPNQMTLTQGTDVVNQNLVPTNTDSTVSNVSGVPTTGYVNPSAYNGYVSPITLQQIAAQQSNTVTDPKSYTVSGGLELPKGVGVNNSPAQNNLGPLNISTLGAVISPQAMNSTAGGIPSLVGPQVTGQPQPAVNYTYAPSSQQQLEDQAINAGYQGYYSDTAAMQGYLNSNAGGVASLVSPQPTSNIVAGVGTNPALRAKVLAAQAANMKK